MFKIFLHVVIVSSDRTCIRLDSAVGTVDAIGETVEFMSSCRNSAFDVHRELQKAVMSLCVIGCIALKGKSMAILLDALKKF